VHLPNTSLQLHRLYKATQSYKGIILHDFINSFTFYHSFSTNFPFVVFVVAGCIAYVLAVVVSFIVVFLYCVVVFMYCVTALFVCNVCYLSIVLLYYCHRAEVQLQFNKYIYNTNRS
jgi:hypothetical protein